MYSFILFSLEQCYKAVPTSEFPGLTVTFLSKPLFPQSVECTLHRTPSTIARARAEFSPRGSVQEWLNPSVLLQVLGASSNLCDDSDSLFLPLREHLAICLKEDAMEISVSLILNLHLS